MKVSSEASLDDARNEVSCVFEESTPCELLSVLEDSASIELDDSLNSSIELEASVKLEKSEVLEGSLELEGSETKEDFMELEDSPVDDTTSEELLELSDVSVLCSSLEKLEVSKSLGTPVDVSSPDVVKDSIVVRLGLTKSDSCSLSLVVVKPVSDCVCPVDVIREDTSSLMVLFPEVPVSPSSSLTITTLPRFPLLSAKLNKGIQST